MRSRFASQIRQSPDVCIFCALTRGRDVTTLRNVSRLPKRALSSSVSRRTPAGTAAAKKEDDDDNDDFPLLRQNAAGVGSWPTARPLSRTAPLPPPLPGRTPVDPQPQRKWSMNRGSNLRPPNDGNSQRASDFRSRDGQRQHSRPARWTERDGESFTRGSAGGQGGFRITRHVTRGETARGSQDGSSVANSGPGQGRPLHRAFESRRKTDNMQDKGFRRVRINLEPLPETAADQRSREAAIPRNQQQQEQGPRTAKRPTLKSPVQDEHKGHSIREEPEDASFRSKFRRSDRFASDEDEVEAQLPAATAAYKSASAPSERASRARMEDFDFDVYEADQGLYSEGRRKKKGKKQKRAEIVEQKPTLVVPEFISVQQLAQAMKVKVDDLIAKLEEEGFEGARYDHMLDAETSAMFADIYGFEPVAGAEEVQDLVARPLPENVTDLPPRPPIVTIMGHVDHGKTTILDWLRKSSVAAGEHGGITQHIGAFSVIMPGSERQITFLDTPGHEAFLDMRRRGANVTDIVVLVVAADDSVKPQTVEAIKHALDAKVQLIVAINKVDKYDANVERVKQDLTKHDIVVEDYGGDYQAIPVSGKTGQGMEQLEEAIITLADVLDLRAEQEGPAEGSIIESKITNAGRVATVLVRRGVLRVGDFIVAGPTWGRVRTLKNDTGKSVQAAYPGDPVQVDGWRGEDPTAGLEVLQADDEQHAKDVIELRRERALTAQASSDIAALNATRTQEAEARAKVLAWEKENRIHAKRRTHNEGWVDAAANSGPKQVHFVVKADVAGSVEAIVHAVSAIGNHEIQANVIHSGTGPITESDIRMLATTGEVGYAISFNQQVDGAVMSLAHAAGLQILDHNIIYRVTEAVKEKVQDALPPLVTQRVLGEAEVGQIFEIKLKGKLKLKIAGCRVTNGTISRANQVRVIRKGETIYTGTLDSLKNVKKDVTEMHKGSECGMAFKDWENVQEGDQIQCFEEKEEKRKLY